MENRLEICGLNHARKIKRAGFDAILSITDPGKNTLSFHSHPQPKHLILEFEDTDYDVPNVKTATINDIFKALDFGVYYYGYNKSMLVHCAYGRSRSTAVALGWLIAKEAGSLEVAVEKALDKLYKIRPQALPSLLIVKHLDEIFGCNSLITDALKKRESRNINSMKDRALRKSMGEYMSRKRGRNVE
jgi:predicted protein tyrosine phosphatase